MGLVRPTSLLCAGAPGYHRSVGQPTLGPFVCRLLSAASSPVERWASGPLQTDGRAQGDGWGTQTGRLTSRGSVETRGRSKPHSRLRSDVRGLKRSQQEPSSSYQHPLLSSAPEESSRLDIALINAISSCLGITPIAWAHFPITLLPLIHKWVRGSTPVKTALFPLSVQYTTPFTDPNKNLLQSQTAKDLNPFIQNEWDEIARISAISRKTAVFHIQQICSIRQ
jgi:hypothetical protein